MKRRQFVKSTSASALGFYLVPRHVLGGPGFTAPSDKLNIGAIGVGGKGEVNITLSYNNGSDNMVALCDVDDRMAVERRKQFPNVPYYRDFREMLDKEDQHLDAVLVSTPDHMHGVMALEAMKRGKHVYCEKPLTHDIYEARILTRAASKYQVVTQMGNQGSSGDSTRYIESWIQQGLIGDVNKVHVWTNRPVWPQGIPIPKEHFPIPGEVDWDLWLGTAPERPFNPIYIPANWRGWVDFGTGALGDMGCHFMDVPFRALKLGYPDRVYCSASSKWNGFFEVDNSMDSYPAASKIHLHFPARTDMVPVELIWYDGGILPERPRELLPDESMGEWDGGILFEGTSGKMMAGLFGRNPTILPTRMMKDIPLPEPARPLVPGGEEGHQQQWVKACKAGYGAYTSSSFADAGPLTETVIMGNLAVLTYNYAEPIDDWVKWTYPGRKELLWDGPNMKITNFEPANQFVRRNYRGDWQLNLD